MQASVTIGGRTLAPGRHTYVIAEMSANHNQSYEDAVKIVHAAKQAGADAVKLQTYTPDTMTIDSNRPPFHIKGTLWEGRRLHELYGEAHTPWEWQPRLMELARSLGMDLFSTPFDATSVDFLEKMGVPAYKIASFEIVDLPLLRRVAATGKPIIMSTGMATLAEIEEAVSALRNAGANQIVLLKCTSAYPADPAEMNLVTIPHLSAAFGVPTGLSDHTLGLAVPITAVALGACVIEKHFTLSRASGGPDAEFSLEPDEFTAMVAAVRTTERALGSVHYGVSPSEAKSRVFRRSLFVVQDVKAGEVFSLDNVRSIRPAHGLHPRHLEEVIGKVAVRDIARGEPLAWELVRERKGESE